MLGGRPPAVSNRHPNTAQALYARRWQIETLFGVLKSRGFDLEATHLAASARIGRLFGLLTVALVWVLGVAVARARERREPTKTHGRAARSLFRVGLDHLTLLLSRGDSRALRRAFPVLSST